VITANSAQQIPIFHLKCDHPHKYNPRYPQLCTKRKRKEKKGKGKERKVERSYQVRGWVHLNYYLLRTVMQEVEGASAISSHLNI